MARHSYGTSQQYSTDASAGLVRLEPCKQVNPPQVEGEHDIRFFEMEEVEALRREGSTIQCERTARAVRTRWAILGKADGLEQGGVRLPRPETSVLSEPRH
jgi:hypothetical protein